MSSVIHRFTASAAPEYVLYEFHQIRDGHKANPFADPISRQSVIINDIMFALNNTTIAWSDIMDTIVLHDLVSKEWEERRLKLLSEATSNKFQGEAINTFIYQRADRSYKQAERLGITKKGPCCRSMDMSSEDRSCWSFEYEDPKVKSELNKLEAELVEMQGTVEKMERDGIHRTDRVRYDNYLKSLLVRMDVWIAEAAALEASVVKKPHTCPWIHPGEVGWCDSWYEEYQWRTPEERKRKWAKFWVNGKMEYKEAPPKKEEGRKNFRPQDDRRPRQERPHQERPQYKKASSEGAWSRETMQKTDDVPIRRSLMASKMDDDWEAVPVKNNGGKSGKSGKERW